MRDETGLWTMLNGSLAGRAINGVAGAWGRATSGSRAAATWDGAKRGWTTLSPIDRWRFVGTACTIGTATHLLMGFSRSPIGLWWLIIPAIVASFGVLALVISWMASPPR